MKTAQFFLGISVFVLLIVDVFCLPVRKGLLQGPPQSGSNTGATTNYASNYGPPAGRFSPVQMSNVNSPNYMTGPEPGSFQPSYYRDSMSVGGPVPPQSGLGPAGSMPSQPVFVPGQPEFVPGANMAGQPGFAPGASGSLQPSAPAGASLPAQSAYTSSSSMNAPPALNSGPAQPIVSVQSESSDINWAVPPKMFSEDVSSQSASVNQVLADESQFLPPGPLRQAFQSGELSHFEKNAESGASQSETEEVGYPPSPPGPLPFSPELLMSGPAGPRLGVGGLLGYPYPYLDFMFLTGQYPPGTVSHFSQNFEHGRDYYHDTHYTKEHSPGSGGPGAPGGPGSAKAVLKDK